jgi:hypothetical protein
VNDIMSAEIVILNDGETYSSIDGCVILEVPSELLGTDEIEDYIEENYYKGRPVN